MYPKRLLLLSAATSVDDPLNGPTTVVFGSTTVNEPLPAALARSALSLNAPAGNVTSIFPSGNAPVR